MKKKRRKIKKKAILLLVLITILIIGGIVVINKQEKIEIGWNRTKMGLLAKRAHNDQQLNIQVRKAKIE